MAGAPGHGRKMAGTAPNSPMRHTCLAQERGNMPAGHLQLQHILDLKEQAAPVPSTVHCEGHSALHLVGLRGPKSALQSRTLDHPNSRLVGVWDLQLRRSSLRRRAPT